MTEIQSVIAWGWGGKAWRNIREGLGPWENVFLGATMDVYSVDSFDNFMGVYTSLKLIRLYTYVQFIICQLYKNIIHKMFNKIILCSVSCTSIV